MEHSIKLKYSGEPLSAQDALQAIGSVAGVDLVRCVRIPDGYRAVVARAEDLTPFLSSAGQARLTKHKFEAILSPELRATCTVLARKLDRTVVTRTVAAIRDAIQYTNDVKIVEVYIPPESQLAKIRCVSPEDAQKLLKGFKLFNTSVPAYNVKLDEYIKIDHCYRCYSLDHVKSACKRTSITCSRCSQEGHFFAGCTNPFVCRLCGGAHSAISGLCPKRRAKLKILREHNKQTNMSQPTTSQHTTATIKPPRNTTATTFAQIVQPHTSATLGDVNNTQHTDQQTQHTQHPQTQTHANTDTDAVGRQTIDKMELITTCILTTKALWGDTDRRTLANKIHEILLANKLQDVVIPEGWLSDTPLEAGASPQPNTELETFTTPQAVSRPRTPTATPQHETTKSQKRRITPPQSYPKRSGREPERAHYTSPVDTVQSESDYGEGDCDSAASFITGTGVRVHSHEVGKLTKWTVPLSPIPFTRQRVVYSQAKKGITPPPLRRRPRLKKNATPLQVEHIVSQSD